MEYAEFKATVRVEVERFMASALAECADDEVCRIARHVALGGGHRWRALVTVAAGRIFRPDALRIVMPTAAGIELAHAASLVLDDLPSMDDAALRRGKPCAHRVFPRWAVDLAPVFMVTLSYRLALANPLAPPDRRVDAAAAMSVAGLEMVIGQAQDVKSSQSADETEAQVLDRYLRKSGALYGTSARSGGVLCGATAEQADRLYGVGLSLGLAYQFLDDVADAVAHAGQIGKDTGRDGDKTTAVALFGVDGARSRSRAYQDEALAGLAEWGAEADLLRQLVSEASWAAA
ncbi:MAG: Geranylgeranyl diphosphate synthase [Phycisphaerae bacterium]|nr:Geranylgeranyl diphosphate synthase [Phycisphaerae bacterium]